MCMHSLCTILSRQDQSTLCDNFLLHIHTISLTFNKYVSHSRETKRKLSLQSSDGMGESARARRLCPFYVTTGYQREATISFEFSSPASVRANEGNRTRHERASQRFPGKCDVSP